MPGHRWKPQLLQQPVGGAGSAPGCVLGHRADRCPGRARPCGAEAPWRPRIWKGLPFVFYSSVRSHQPFQPDAKTPHVEPLPERPASTGEMGLARLGDCSQFLGHHLQPCDFPDTHSPLTDSLSISMATGSHVYRHLRRGRDATRGTTDLAGSEIHVWCSGALSLFTHSVYNTHKNLTPRPADRTHWLACTLKIHLCVSDKGHTRPTRTSLRRT